MKIITFLVLIIITTVCHSQPIDIWNFKINENLNRNFNRGSRIHYSFEIKGDYTYQTHGYRRIDLIFNTYTEKEMWVTINDNSTLTRAGKRFVLVAKYAGITKQYTYIYPNPDSDNDGVPDSIDSCSNEAEPSSNNGCPFVNLTNLEVTHLRILRNGTIEIFNSNTNSTAVLFNCSPLIFLEILFQTKKLKVKKRKSNLFNPYHKEVIL